jgi:hypothetical protein
MKIAKVWVDSTHVFAETTDGIRASYAFADWPRLANATDEQRRDFPKRASFSCLYVSLYIFRLSMKRPQITRISRIILRMTEPRHRFHRMTQMASRSQSH